MDNLPTCQVCHQQFKLRGPAPYLLPCLHPVCETCVTSTAGEVISCSTCQKEVNLTEKHLQKDVVRQREIFHLTVQHRPSELLCTHEDDGNQAVCWCQECEEFLCEHCQNMHESFKATRRHAVQEVGDIQPGGLHQEEYCSIHKKYLLDFWDKKCNILICAKCKLGDHCEHDMEDIDAAADAARTEIESQKRDVQYVSASHISLLETTKEQLVHTNDTSSNLTEKNSHTFHSLKALLDQREKELLIALKQHKDQTKSHLDAKANVAQSSHVTCKMTTDYMQKVLLYSSKYDLLNLMETMRETTQVCLSTALPKEQEDLPLPELSIEGLERLKTAMGSFGDLVILKDGEYQRGFSEDKAVQTDAEWLANLEEIQKEHKETIQTFKTELATAESVIKQLETSVATLAGENKGATSSLTDSLTKLKDAESEVSQLKISVTKLTGDKDDIQKKGEAAASFFEMQLREEGIYLLKPNTLDKSFLLKCLQLKFDRDRVYVNMVHINTEGELVNKPDTRPHDHSKDRLVKYWGTTNIFPLPLCGTPQYWEMRARVGIDKTLTENALLLEIGMSVEEERDKHHCIAGRPHSYSLTVSHCTTHSSICREVRKHGKYVLCLPDTLPNIPGQPTTLHYGVVFDNTRSKAVFMDITNNKVISVIDGVDCSRPLWPMFGVHNPYLASVSMSLVVGNDIDMSEGKKALILKSLS